MVAKERVRAVQVLEELEAAQERELRTTREILARLKGMAVIVPTDVAPVSQEYADLGPIEAIRRYMKEVNVPQTTRQLADALLARGLRTKSMNITASIHATLKNAPQDFHRNNSGEWVLGPKPKEDNHDGLRR